MPLKYFAYCRKSTESEERQALSIPAQIDAVNDYAQEKSLTVSRFFIEKKTAKIPGRPVFNNLIQLIKAGVADGIIAWHPDRLSRNAVDSGQIMHLLDMGYLKDLKFKAHCFENSPEGKFLLSIAFGQSKYFIDNLAVNTKRGLMMKCKKGEFPAPAPRGYLNNKLTKKIEPNPQTAPTIIKAFEMYSRGFYTLMDISAYLFKQNIRTRKGGALSIQSVSWIMTNPFYYGLFRYAGEIYEGLHQPLITKKLFDQVQACLFKRSPKKLSPKQKLWPRHQFAFTGVMKCGECGQSITAEQHVKHYLNGNSQTFVYYRCHKKFNKEKCYQPYVPEPELNEQIRKIICAAALKPNETDQLNRWLDRDELIFTKGFKAAQRIEEDKIKKLNDRLNQLLTLFLDKTIEREEYLSQKHQLLAEKKETEEKIFALLTKKPDEGFSEFRTWIGLIDQAEDLSRSFEPLKAGSWLKSAGLNLKLKDKKAEFTEGKWSALPAAAPTVRMLVAGLGFEPRILHSECRVMPFHHPAVTLIIPSYHV